MNAVADRMKLMTIKPKATVILRILVTFQIPDIRVVKVDTLVILITNTLISLVNIPVISTATVTKITTKAFPEVTTKLNLMSQTMKLVRAVKVVYKGLDAIWRKS